MELVRERYERRNARGSIELVQYGDIILVRPTGHVDFPESVVAFERMLTRTEHAHFVGMFAQLETYTSEDRRAYISTCIQHRRRLQRMSLIQANALIRIASSALVLAGIDVQFYDSLAESGVAIPAQE